MDHVWKKPTSKCSQKIEKIYYGKISKIHIFAKGLYSRQTGWCWYVICFGTYYLGIFHQQSGEPSRTHNQIIHLLKLANKFKMCKNCNF